MTSPAHPVPGEWLPIETWLPAPGWEARYEVSRFGNLRHLDGREVGQFPNSQGYMLARLSKPRRQVRVHRLVALAFLPKTDGRDSVNHIDCNRSNNNVSNLEWCTQMENIRHSRSLGRMPSYWKGKRSPSAILSDQQVRELRTAYSTGEHSIERLGRMLGISKRAAGRAIKGETYSDVR